MLLSIVCYPNPSLQKMSTPLMSDQIQKPELQKFFDDLIETMYKADGIGIASSQVGKNIRVAALAREDGEADILINPRIISRSRQKEIMEEGCLSLPGVFGEVSRPRAITYESLDRQARVIKRKVEGLAARVVLHEIDHLDGILFASRALRITANVSNTPLPPRLK